MEKSHRTQKVQSLWKENKLSAHVYFKGTIPVFKQQKKHMMRISTVNFHLGSGLCSSVTGHPAN